MNGCVYRTADNQCQKYSDPVRNTMSWCVSNEPCEGRTPSNADPIRSMSDEELADWFCQTKYREGDFCPPKHGWQYCIMADGCRVCWLDWLKSPVEVQK